MRVYQYKYNEIFIIESFLHENRRADAYDELFDELLLASYIGSTKVYQLFNIPDNKITSAPQIVTNFLKRLIRYRLDV